MKKPIFAAALAIALFLGHAALAAEFIAPSKQDNGNVTVSGSETHRNLYTAGANVTLNGPTTGDLYVAGSSVTLNGNVERDLMTAAGTININAPIGGNAHVAGGNLTINSAVNGDLMIVGGNVTLTEKAAIAGDLVIGGGNLIVDGPVAGDVRVGGGKVSINGKVNGDVYARVTDQLTFGSNSEVVGKVQLKSPKEAVVSQGAKVSSIDYTKIEVKKGDRGARGWFTFGFLIKLIASFIAGWLLLHFARRFSTDSSSLIRTGFWPSLGIGLVFLIVTPIIGILLFVTVVGYYLAILLFLFYAFALMIAGLIMMIFAGSWLWGLVNKRQIGRSDWLTLIVGVIVIGLVSLIPVVGWLAILVLFLAALGSAVRIMLGTWRRAAETNNTPPPPQIA